MPIKFFFSYDFGISFFFTLEEFLFVGHPPVKTEINSFYDFSFFCARMSECVYIYARIRNDLSDENLEKAHHGKCFFMAM